MTALLIRVEATEDGRFAVRVGTEIVDVCEHRVSAERVYREYLRDPDGAAHAAYCAKLDRERWPPQENGSFTFTSMSRSPRPFHQNNPWC